MSRRSFFLCLSVCAFAAVARADGEGENKPPKAFGSHYGYTFEVKEERDRRDVEMVMLEEPKPYKPIRDLIFNEKLSREFQEQYRYRFGQSQAELVINSPARDDQYTYYTGQNVTVQDYQMYQRQFAEYMGRRLTEYHVDHWAKNDPQLRPVYEMKDRIGHVDVTVKKGYNIKWKYNFAGPNMDVKVENPYEVDLRLRMEMGGIISSPSEYIYTLSYPVSRRVNFSAMYKHVDGIYQLVWARRMTKHISMSLTGSVDALPAGTNVQQNLALVGFSWSE